MFTSGQIVGIDYHNHTVLHQRNGQWEDLQLSYREYMDCVIAKTTQDWIVLERWPSEQGGRIQSEIFKTSTKRKVPPKYILGEQTYQSHKQKIEKIKQLRSTTKSE